MSDAEKVKMFTEETGFKIPEVPEAMSKEEVYFIIKMILDEVMELGATVENPKEVKEYMIKCINESKDINMIHENTIANQADAFVDIYYYSLNAACKKGVNLSKIFDIVHDANLKKKDPNTGKYLRRDDGKIMKPPMWKEPDIVGEINNQSIYGAF